MAFRSYRKRRGNSSRYRRSKRTLRMRSFRRRKSGYTKRRRFGKFRKSRVFNRTSKYSGYVPQQRSFKRASLFTKSSRVFGRNDKRGVICTARELLGVICNPWFNSAANNMDTYAKVVTFMDANPNKVNVFKLPGASRQYVIPPEPTADNNLLPISNYTTVGTTASIPKAQNGKYPWAYIDGEAGDSSTDYLRMQPGTLVSVMSPQNGQMPKLNEMGKQYERYRVLAAQYMYVTGCTTTAKGIVQMGITTNPTSIPPTARGDMMAQSNSCANSVYTNGVLNYKPSREWKFVTSPITGTKVNLNRTPDRFSDSYTFYAACFDTDTTDTPANSAVLGYIYVTYVVEFRGPSTQTTVGNPQNGVSALSAPVDGVPVSSGTKDEQGMTDAEIEAMYNRNQTPAPPDIDDDPMSSVLGKGSVDCGPPKKTVKFEKRSLINMDDIPIGQDVEYDDGDDDDDDDCGDLSKTSVRVPVLERGVKKTSK